MYPGTSIHQYGVTTTQTNGGEELDAALILG